jgi:hypothetical protein
LEVAFALLRGGIMEDAIARTPAEPVRLCYLDAMHLEGPLPEFDGAEVRTSSDRKIGHLDGIVVDPAARRVRYLVVDTAKSPGRHRYLVPVDATRVDVKHRALCVEVDRTDLARCEEFDADAFSHFSFRPRKA